MVFLAPEFEDEYLHRYTLTAALDKWVEMLAAAGENGLPSDPSLHVNYARALGVTVDDFYVVLRMAIANGQMVVVEPPPPTEPAPEPVTLPAAATPDEPEPEL
jgi:hypothetical protein